MDQIATLDTGLMMPRLGTRYQPCASCMEKLDGLGWTAGLAFESYGLRIGVRTNAPDMLPQLGPYLPPDWSPVTDPEVDWLYSLKIGGEGPRPGVRHFHLAYSDSALIGRSREMEPVLHAVEADIQAVVANLARERLFVHAGVVGWGEQAILIPGESRSGKTSLVEAFLRAGATYYSDEYAVLDQAGRVHPFPRPLGVRHRQDNGWTRQPAEGLGAAVGQAALPVGLVLLTEYRPTAHWRPRPVSRGQAAIALFARTFVAHREPILALDILQRAVAEATALKGARGEADEVVSRVLARLSTSRPQSVR